MKLLKFISTVVLFVFDWLLTGWITCYMWNGILPPLLGVTEITFWQGRAIALLITWFATSHRKEDKEKNLIESIMYDIFLTLFFGAIAFVYISLAF